MTTGKNVNVEAALAVKLKDFAWSQRRSVSAVIQEIVTDYAEGNLETPSVAEPAPPVVNVKYNEPPKYKEALDRAQQDGVPLTDVIRFHLAKRLSVG